MVAYQKQDFINFRLKIIFIIRLNPNLTEPIPTLLYPTLPCSTLLLPNSTPTLLLLAFTISLPISVLFLILKPPPWFIIEGFYDTDGLSCDSGSRYSLANSPLFTNSSGERNSHGGGGFLGSIYSYYER